MTLATYIQAIRGALSQDPVQRPAVVGVLPDDYLPTEYFHEGVFGIDLAAGGAGFRSEVSFFNLGRQIASAWELTLWVSTSVANTGVQIAAPSAGFSGFTAVNVFLSDLDATQGGAVILMRPNELNVGTKNTAAATAGTTLASFVTSTANLPFEIPGRFVLRATRTGGGQILVRPAADNVGIRVFGRFRRLEKRSL